MQRFKSVYFSDYPATEAKRRNLTLAFGPEDEPLFHLVSGLSSESLRQAIGLPSFHDVKNRAGEAGLSLNAFCIERLRQFADRTDAEQMSLPSIVEQRLSLDPIQATFRGGKEEPLHSWFPYLEGYSPEFVHAVLKAFAPNAKHVFDPFGGSGTTPLTTARLGIRGTYCELNPALQFLIKTKIEVLYLSASEQTSLARLLLSLAESVKEDVLEHDPDRRLADAYSDTFGASEFFPPDTYETVLRLRTWLDSLDCKAPKAANVATVAVISSLIPASNLIRRGDLRFRKSATEKKLRSANILRDVSLRLESMARDLTRLDVLQHRPIFIAADAKRLDRCANLDVDAIVTSPPYLNGTNYYRNTKVELWFLRALRSSRDLAMFRRQTVTAGINDVTVGKKSEAVCETVASVVRALESDAYDHRIPQMVLHYFADMNLVFEGLTKHIRPRAPLLLDIGDSAYAGVHVDTPRILAEILENQKWKVNQRVILRERLSRSGVPLKQVLLVAEAPTSSPKVKRVAPRWRKKWNHFQSNLPHQSGAFAKRNWGSPLHSLCSYQGKMKPALAQHLVGAFLSKGDRMVDPFGGVGTIPFEAALLGVESWSFDISPAAVVIASAKLEAANAQDCERLIHRLGEFIASQSVTEDETRAADEIRFNGALPDYFHPKTFHEILLARRFFLKEPPAGSASSLVFAALLHVLHGNRPYALSRRSHPITPFAPTGNVEYKSLIGKVKEKVERSLAVDRSMEFVTGRSLFQDATGLWPVEVDNLDAVITSPPFFDSTRFYLANWMRLWFCGWTANDFKQRPLAFVDERQKRSFSVYEAVLRQSRERMKLGGVCVFHLGKSAKCDMAEELSRVAKSWFAHSEVFIESVAHCESHGISDKGAVSEHAYLVLH